MCVYLQWRTEQNLKSERYEKLPGTYETELTAFLKFYYCKFSRIISH